MSDDGLQPDAGVPSSARAPRGALDARERLAALLPGIVHELKHPLAVVDGYAQLLLGRWAADAEASDDLAVVLREARRLQRGLDDLLAWTRADARPAEALDARELVEAAFGVCAFALRQAGVRARHALDEDVRVLGRRPACVDVFVTMALLACARRARSLDVRIAAGGAASGVTFACALDAQDAPSSAALPEFEALRDATARAGGALIVDAGAPLRVVLPRAT